MAKVSKECLDEALAGLKNISREELRDYVHDVFATAREGDMSVEKAMSQVNNEKLASFFEAATTKANNTKKVNYLVDKIKTKATDMRSIFIQRFDNLGDNISSSIKSAHTKLHTVIFNNLTEEETEYFSTGKNDDEIVSALDGKEVKNPMAKKIASIIKEYIEYRNAELVISNAMPLQHINGDRMLRHIHDAGRIRNGGKSLIESAKDFVNRYDNSQAKPLWVEFIKKHLDLEGTFARTDAIDNDGNINMDKVDEILNRTFDNITTNKNEIFTKSVVANDREAVAAKSRMFFKFKDWSALHKYNKQYGKGNLFESLLSDVSASSTKIGSAELLGDSPFKAYNDLAHAQHEFNTKPQGWYYKTGLYFNEALHLDKSSPRPTVANVMTNIRTVTSMARLFKLALRSVPDIANAVSFDVRWGDSYYQSLIRNLQGAFNYYKGGNRAIVGKQFKHMIDSHQGYMGRFMDANNTSQMMQKVSARYFSFTQMSGWDNGLKTSAMTGIMERAGMNSKRSLSKCNSSFRKQILKFMDEKDWDLLRSKTKGKLFSLENVEALTDEDLKGHAEHTDMPLHEVRNTLYRKVNAMFDVASQNAVLTPGEFERANLIGDTKSGTLNGEFWRSVMQFKSYTLSYFDRVIHQGWKDADSFQQKLSWGVGLLAMTYPLSVLSTALDYWSDGLSFPSWDRMTVPERIKFHVGMAASPLGMLSVFLDPRHANASYVLNLLGSPSINLLGDLLGTVDALSHGNTDQAKKNMKHALNYILPMSGIPFISPLLRQGLGEQAHLQPGQRILYGR